MFNSYKFIRKISLIFISLLFVNSQSFAQRTVDIQPGFGTISSTIFGDTTDTGARKDLSTIYVLQRDGLYILDGTFEPDFPVDMEASGGSGARPRIILGVPSGGSTPSQAIRPKSDLTLKGLYVSCRDELGGLGLRIFRVSSNKARIVLNDCVLDIAGQSAFRMDGTDCDIIMNNCVVSNIGETSSPDNGRVVDDRGNDIDSLICVNNTFYNITYRVLRDGGGIIKYAKFDHNTMVNIGSGAVDIGQAYTTIFTNNILINCGFYGSRSGEAQDYNVIIDTVLVDSITQITNISNNNYYNSPDIKSSLPDTVNPIMNYNPAAQAFLNTQGTGNTDISEDLTFTKGPSTPADVITAYWTDPGAAQPSLDTTDHSTFNFSYPTSAASYTASVNGQPLGAVNWFGITLGVAKEANMTAPDKYNLFQNYPNPFNPSTVIMYKVAKGSKVVLSVYSMLGQLVKTLVNSEQGKGIHYANWNGTNSAGQKVSSGIYMYRLQAGKFISSKKMILLK